MNNEQIAEQIASELRESFEYLEDKFDIDEGVLFGIAITVALRALEHQEKRIAESLKQWTSIETRKPDILEVRVKLVDGSEVECWSQSDGDFYWKGGGSETFISENTVTHWMPSLIQEKDV